MGGDGAVGSPGGCWGWGGAGSTGQGVVGASRLLTTRSGWDLGFCRFCHSKEIVFVPISQSAYLGIKGISFSMTGLLKIQEGVGHSAGLLLISRNTMQCSGCWDG